MRVVSDAGEYVQNRPLGFRCVEHAIGGEEWNAQLLRQFDAGFIGTLFAANVVALDFDEEIFAAKNIAEMFDAM